jgi:hypothetical protein
VVSEGRRSNPDGSGLNTRSPWWAGGEYCDVPHFVYLASGELHVVFADGAEIDLKAGDIATIPAGHDGWVVGDEPAVMFDFGAIAKPF